jgi:hypothetical protein
MLSGSHHIQTALGSQAGSQWVQRTSYSAIFILSITLLVGCASPTGKIDGSDLAALRLGMSKQEVISALGPPQNVSAKDYYESFRYFEDADPFGLIYYELVFVDEKLKLYGLSNDPAFRPKVQSATNTPLN